MLVDYRDALHNTACQKTCFFQLNALDCSVDGRIVYEPEYEGPILMPTELVIMSKQIIDSSQPVGVLFAQKWETLTIGGN